MRHQTPVRAMETLKVHVRSSTQRFPTVGKRRGIIGVLLDDGGNNHPEQVTNWRGRGSDI
jgi:hypothetical protein